MPDDNDDERHGELIPPSRQHKVSRMYDGGRALNQDVNLVHPGWGLGNLVETLRNRSAARLMDARTANVEALTRLLYALNDLGFAMVSRERVRRAHENLDQILDQEEAHDRTLLSYKRRAEIAEAERRLREAELSRDRVNEQETKQAPRKADIADRIRAGVEKRRYLREQCDELIAQVRAAAKNSGTENSPEVEREIENIRGDFAKAIADTHEKG